MKLKTIHKIQAVVFSLTFVLGCFLLVTNYSYGSDVLGANTEESQITIPYDKDYLLQLENRGLKIKVQDSGEYLFRAEDLGITIIKTPNIIQEALDKRPSAIIQLNSDRYENTINKIAETIRTDQLDGNVSILGGQLIYIQGELGKVMIKDNAVPLLISALQKGDSEINFGIAKIKEKRETDYNKIKQQFENITTANYWLQYENNTAKIDTEELVETLKIVNNRITADREELKTVLHKMLDQYYKTSVIEGIDDTAHDTVAQVDGAVSKIIDDIESGKIQVQNLYSAAITEIPGTNGSYAPRYSEVDLSQQKMYVWQDHELVREFKISSGAYDRTPTGEFEIKNKATNTYSTIFKKYMPYWMAFAYLPEFKSFAGFHELTYWKDENGNYVYEADDRIGQPVSGGCIRLSRGEAKEFYTWSEIGDKVLIHE